MDLNLKAYQDYLIKEKNYSPLTVKAYLDDILSFKNYLLNQDVALEEVVYPNIRSWMVELMEQKIAPSSINRKISALKSYYKFLLKIKEIKINPLLKHKSIKVAKKIQTPFSEVELKNVSFEREGIDDFEKIRNRFIIELFYTTGIRRAELINLKNNSVDEVQRTLKVIGKRNKERILPMIQATFNLYQDYKLQRFDLKVIKDDEFLILSKKGLKLSESFVYRLINDYFSEVSKKEKKSPHVLRHTFATHLLNNGADLNSVKELLGHASLSSTQIYTHSSLSELKKVYNEAHPRNKK